MHAQLFENPFLDHNLFLLFIFSCLLSYYVQTDGPKIKNTSIPVDPVMIDYYYRHCPSYYYHSCCCPRSFLVVVVVNHAFLLLSPCGGVQNWKLANVAY